jgi:hypothetical protein
VPGAPTEGLTHRAARSPLPCLGSVRRGACRRGEASVGRGLVDGRLPHPSRRAQRHQSRCAGPDSGGDSPRQRIGPGGPPVSRLRWRRPASCCPPRRLEEPLRDQTGQCTRAQGDQFPAICLHHHADVPTQPGPHRHRSPKRNPLAHLVAPRLTRLGHSGRGHHIFSSLCSVSPACQRVSLWRATPDSCMRRGRVDTAHRVPSSNRGTRRNTAGTPPSAAHLRGSEPLWCSEQIAVTNP